MDLNESVNVSNSRKEVRNERRQTILQLYVLSSISMSADNMAYYKLYRTNAKQNALQQFGEIQSPFVF